MRTKSVNVIMAEIDDRPGGLAKVTAQLREARLNQVGAWSWTQGEGKAFTFLLSESPEDTEAALKKAGVRYTLSQACLCEGGDEFGCYDDLLRKVADAGVDLDAACAMGVGGGFRAILWPKEGQLSKLAKALGC